MTTDSQTFVPLGGISDRCAIRMEYEATGADGRILSLLDQLEQAERIIAEQIKRIRDLEGRLTRSPSYTPGQVLVAKS